MRTVEIQIVDSKYVVDYTWCASENYSLCPREDQTSFGFKFHNGVLSHSTRPKGYGEQLINDIMQRLYDIEYAKSRHSDGIWFFCYISRLGV